jgi:hypothetical protein
MNWSKDAKLGPHRNQHRARELTQPQYNRHIFVSMDSPIISRLFRQLFTHRPCRPCQSLRSHSALPFRIQYGTRAQVRCVSGGRGGDAASKNESHWQQRTDLFPLDMREEYSKYPMVTADQLRGRRERPKRVKMLTRDFIEGIFVPLNL